MLKITGIDAFENEVALPSPVYMSINQEIEVPADDLSVTFPIIKGLPELNRILVKENNLLVFLGIVDEQQLICDSKFAYTKIIARSLASLLLDCESKPINYTNPSTSVIFARHLKPLGFKSYKGGDVTYYGSLNVSKGTTNWMAFYNFCINAYGKIPRIEADGTANFSGVENHEVICFSNKEGVSYNSIKENIKRCSIVSKVIVKSGENRDYSTEIVNKDAVEKGIVRVRYMDASSGLITLETADKIIKNSIDGSYEITLVCPHRLLDILGARAFVDDENILPRENLCVSSVHYTLNADGEFTTIKLKKER